jgi:hypothetical protein
MATGEDSDLWYSELGEPFTVASTNFIQVSDGDGEKITGLSVQGDSLLVYKGASVWAIYMEDTTPANWKRIKTNAKYGAASHFAIVDYGQGYQMYLGKRYDVLSGFHALAGLAQLPDKTQLDVAVIQSESKSDKIEPDIFTFNSSQIAKACGINFKNKLWFSVPYSSSTTNSRIYQFDFQRRTNSDIQGSWVPFTGITAAAFTIYSGSLYFQDATANGFVHQLENGLYTDNGAAINSYYWTKEYECHEKQEDFHKDFRYCIFVVETLGDWNMNLTYRTDSDRGSGTTTTINLNPGGSLWGTMIWGVDSWGGGVLRSTKTVYFGPLSGRKIQFKFDNQNTASRSFKVLRGSIYYNLRGQRHGTTY